MQGINPQVPTIPHTRRGPLTLLTIAKGLITAIVKGLITEVRILMMQVQYPYISTYK